MQMAIKTPLQPFLDGGERIFWGYLMLSAAIALVIFIKEGTPFSIKHMRSYFWSADAKLDYCYFLVNWLIKTLLVIPVVLSGHTVAIWTLNFLNSIAEPFFLPWRYQYIVFAYTFSLFIVGDFSRYWLHRWLHANQWLWQFHQVHHSAQSLNPLTYYRVHPVENVLYALRNSVVAGVITGGFVFCFGARVNLYSILGGNLFVVVLFSVTGNLRHSHIRLSYGRWLEHLLISPAQHQVHHQVENMRHNYGSAVALWDWLFGTLKLAKNASKSRNYGLEKNKKYQFNSVVKLLIQPFFRIYKIINGRRND